MSGTSGFLKISCNPSDIICWLQNFIIILQACGLKHLVTTISGYADTAHTYLLRYKCLVKEEL
jgi:hypothetical protein